jgi:hypothetical protein
MDTVGIYLLYLLISMGLTAVVGTGVARSGRALLLDVLGGNDTLARAVSRLIVLGFYLLSLGFITLAMRTGGAVASARDGLQLLSVKVGEVLLVLGALHLLTLVALVRARRLAQARTAQPPWPRPGPLSGGSAPGGLVPGTRESAPQGRGSPAPGGPAADWPDRAATPARPGDTAGCEPGPAPLAGSVLE